MITEIDRLQPGSINSYFADRVAPPNPNATEPDFASLAALENSPALGHHFNNEGWTKTFDRTQWVLTIWFPFVTGDDGEPSLWLHSPPFPAPYCGDRVCEVSRGESNATCPGDCPPTAGKGVCDPGENSSNCPAIAHLNRPEDRADKRGWSLSLAFNSSG